MLKGSFSRNAEVEDRELFRGIIPFWRCTITFDKIHADMRSQAFPRVSWTSCTFIIPSSWCQAGFTAWMSGVRLSTGLCDTSSRINRGPTGRHREIIKEYWKDPHSYCWTVCTMLSAKLYQTSGTRRESCGNRTRRFSLTIESPGFARLRGGRSGALRLRCLWRFNLLCPKACMQANSGSSCCPWQTIVLRISATLPSSAMHRREKQF